MLEKVVVTISTKVRSLSEKVDTKEDSCYHLFISCSLSKFLLFFIPQQPYQAIWCIGERFSLSTAVGLRLSSLVYVSFSFYSCCFTFFISNLCFCLVFQGIRLLVYIFLLFKTIRFHFFRVLFGY